MKKLRRKNGSKPRELRPVSEQLMNQKRILESVLPILTGLRVANPQDRIRLDSSRMHLASIVNSLSDIATSIPDHEADDLAKLCVAIEIAVLEGLGSREPDSKRVVITNDVSHYLIVSLNMVLDALQVSRSEESSDLYSAVRTIRDSVVASKPVSLDAIGKKLNRITAKKPF